jgi:hypothetical protein
MKTHRINHDLSRKYCGYNRYDTTSERRRYIASEVWQLAIASDRYGFNHDQVSLNFEFSEVWQLANCHTSLAMYRPVWQCIVPVQR